MRKTRLLIVSSSLGEGGAQRVTSTVLAHLDRTRFEPSLCVFKPVVTFPVPDDVPVTVLGSRRVAPLAELARSRPWLVADLILRLRRHIKTSRPDVVLSNLDQVNLVTGTALSGLRPRPRWIARIGSDPARQGLIASVWARWALASADAVVVSSTDLGDGLAKVLPTTRPRLRCLPNPTDFARIDALAAAEPVRSRDPDIPLLIAVGRISPEKRPDLMLDVVEDLRRRHPLMLWLCGDGPLAGQMAERVAVRGLAGTVELLGFQDNPYALVAQADLFLLTSDFEGLPNGLIEAQGLGIPAVAFDCRYGVREVVAHGETGLLVPPGDTVAFQAAIAELLADPGRRAQMGRAARERTRRLYGAWLVRDWEDLLGRR